MWFVTIGITEEFGGHFGDDTVIWFTVSSLVLFIEETALILNLMHVFWEDPDHG